MFIVFVSIGVNITRSNVVCKGSVLDGREGDLFPDRKKGAAKQGKAMRKGASSLEPWTRGKG